MINKIKTLVWLRLKQFSKNKSMVMVALMPFGMALIYNAFLNKNQEIAKYLLSMTLTMAFVTSMGNLVLNVISEEKEKNNMRTLILSGVSGFEYIISTLVLPTLFGVFAIVVLPLIVKVDISGYWIQYYSVTILNALATTLLFLLLALVSKNQSTSNMYGNIALIVIMLIPMLSSSSENVNKILKFTFMNSLTELFEMQSSYSLTDSSFIVSFAWVVILASATIILYQNGKRKPLTTVRKSLSRIKYKAKV